MDTSTELGPLTFEPIFMPRIWGGRRLETLFGKRLPQGQSIGESWEIVDRAEAQSVVRAGPLAGQTLHELWEQQRDRMFGPVAPSPRFPLLIKLLDARERLSLQVHPPPDVARKLGAEPKTEFWYIADAAPDAELYAGFTAPVQRSAFEQAIAHGAAEQNVHRAPVRTGDAMFLPSGRLHAIGAGNVIVEIQQNSDSTYRVFDWNRLGEDGTPRQLHVADALESIDFGDIRPALTSSDSEVLVACAFFEVQRWRLANERVAAPAGEFAVIVCLAGGVQCGNHEFRSGEFFVVPATAPERMVRPTAPETTLLRVTIPR